MLLASSESNNEKQNKTFLGTFSSKKHKTKLEKLKSFRSFFSIYFSKKENNKTKNNCNL
jgi:hypothetical protein